MTVDLDDLLQAAFLGVRAAAFAYDPDRGAFAALLPFFVRRACRQTLGLDRQTVAMTSLDAPLNAETDDTLADVLADETVCLLSKLKSNQHIEVELDMDELDLTDAEKKATYQEIKNYVLEHCGLKVSNLYIAQVKQKCGIIERENYNKPKSEDARQPQCPPEKEKAIKEALKHFGMI